MRYAGNIPVRIRTRGTVRIEPCQKANYAWIRPRPSRVRMRKITVQLSRRKHGDLVGRHRLHLPLALIGGEEKEAVLPLNYLGDRNRAADRASKLVSFEDFARLTILIVEKAVGIKCVVAQELKQSAVILVCPRLGNCADDPTGVAAVLGSTVAG